jgi:DMSO/TMAO reductase YedYZ heme-binding membrane subunit
MVTKAYFTFIEYLQQSLLSFSFLLIITLSVVAAYFPDLITGAPTAFLFEVSLFAAFLVLGIRPLADLFPNVAWLRPLVILRKGFGVFSSSIIVAFIFGNIMADAAGYFSSFFSLRHWSFEDYHILAPLADVSALILLVTSNKFSKRVLGPNWKRIQKLAYVYFYAGAFYEYLVLKVDFALWLALIVLFLSFCAFVFKRLPKEAPQPV